MNFAFCVGCGTRIQTNRSILAKFCSFKCKLEYWNKIKKIAEQNVKNLVDYLEGKETKPHNRSFQGEK